MEGINRTVFQGRGTTLTQEEIENFTMFMWIGRRDKYEIEYDEDGNAHYVWYLHFGKEKYKIGELYKDNRGNIIPWSREINMPIYTAEEWERIKSEPPIELPPPPEDLLNVVIY